MAEPLKAIEADAKVDPEGVTVTLVTDEGSVDVLVPPPYLWFEGAVEALTQGRVSDWVHLAVEDSGTLAAWDGLRKRYRDLTAFVEEWTRLTGEDPGKSPASAPSSRSTRKR